MKSIWPTFKECFYLLFPWNQFHEFKKKNNNIFHCNQFHEKKIIFFSHSFLYFIFFRCWRRFNQINQAVNGTATDSVWEAGPWPREVEDSNVWKLNSIFPNIQFWKGYYPIRHFHCRKRLFLTSLLLNHKSRDNIKHMYKIKNICLKVEQF